MSDPEQSTAPRKLSIKWISAGLFLLLIGWFLFQLFGFPSKIIISKETTFITEPLSPDGLPDYTAYILERDSKGVTPENNAAVLLWQATWPGELSQKYWLPMAGALGMKDVPTGQDSLVRVYAKQVREQVSADLLKRYSHDLPAQQVDQLLTPEWQDRLRDEFADLTVSEAMFHPWTNKQLPGLANWEQNNNKSLDMLVEAATRPKFFSPPPPTLDGKKELLLMFFPPEIQGMREAERALLLRAMGHVGEGRTAEAWNDIHACFRLSRHTGTNQFLVGQLVGIAMNGMACRATATLLQHQGLTEAEAKRILVDLQTLPPVSNVANAIGQGERLLFLDSVVRLAQGRLSQQDLTEAYGDSIEMMSRIAINWNQVLLDGNLWYDRLEKAARLPSHEERNQEFANINNDLSQLASKATNPGAVLGSVVSRKRRSQMISDVLLSLLLPALSAASHAEDRGITQQQLTIVAAALAVYRAQHGEYPETLDELAPKILPSVPLDLYSTQPFLYERKGDEGYLLYSVFQNGIDDGGTDQGGEIINGEWIDEMPEDFDHESSDIVIRVPEPLFKFPKLPIEELEQVRAD